MVMVDVRFLKKKGAAWRVDESQGVVSSCEESSSSCVGGAKQEPGEVRTLRD